jgi:hypothetical protein
MFRRVLSAVGGCDPTDNLSGGYCVPSREGIQGCVRLPACGGSGHILGLPRA